MIQLEKFYNIPKKDAKTDIENSVDLLIFIPKPNEKEQELLENILKATKLGQEQLCIVQVETDQDPIDLASILRRTEIPNILIFGHLDKALNINAQLQAYHFLDVGKSSITKVADLSTMLQNKEHKAALWKILKYWFNI